jgi:membrane protease subunit (stomatin/prohibitin family)
MTFEHAETLPDDLLWLHSQIVIEEPPTRGALTDFLNERGYYDFDIESVRCYGYFEGVRIVFESGFILPSKNECYVVSE